MDENGKGKVVIRETKPEGRISAKKNETGEGHKEENGGDDIADKKAEENRNMAGGNEVERTEIDTMGIILEVSKNSDAIQGKLIKKAEGTDKISQRRSGDIICATDAKKEINNLNTKIIELEHSQIQNIFALSSETNPKEGISGEIYNQNLQYLKDIKNHLDSQTMSPLPELKETTLPVDFMGSDRKIDNLVQDNHPEKLLGTGMGIIGKHTVPAGNNLLTSYHENRVTEGIDTYKDKDGNDVNIDVGKSRNIVYSFTAKNEETTITFQRANFESASTGIKSGAYSAGENFKEKNSGEENFDKTGVLNGLMNNGYIKGPDGIIKLDEEKLKELEQKGKITDNNGKISITLNPGETFSFQSPKTLENKRDVFSSVIEFYNDHPVDIEIRSVKETKTTQNELDKLSSLSPEEKIENQFYREWFDTDAKDLKSETGHFEISNNTLEKLGTYDFNKDNLEKLVKLKNKEFSEEEIRNKLKGEFDSSQINIILNQAGVSNYNPDGSTKQVSGVFENPNRDITGTIIAGNENNAPYWEINDKTIEEFREKLSNLQINALKSLVDKKFPLKDLEKELKKLDINQADIKKILCYCENPEPSSIIMIPPLNMKSEGDNLHPYKLVPDNTEEIIPTGINEKKEEITNEGAFSQNFHYNLEIDNYKSDKEYVVVLVPGGGQIGYETKEGFIKVPDEDNGTEAITIPSKVNKETGCIDFNFFVAGGFSTPIYAKVVEADSLFKNNTAPVNSNNND